MTTGFIGQPSGSTVVPISAFTQQTKWISVTNSAYITLSGSNLNTPLVSYAYIMAYADSAGLWHFRFNMKVTGTSTGVRTAATVTMSAPYATPCLAADQSFLVIADTNFATAVGAAAGSALYISHASLNESVYVLSGDVVLASQPSWANSTTLENNVNVAAYFPYATASAQGLAYLPAGEIWVTNATGYGSSGTCIRKFGTVTTNSGGSAITYASDATNGDTFTILQAGIYAIQYSDINGSTSITIGVSKNSSQLSTSVDSITLANRLVKTFTVAGSYCTCNTVAILAIGDIVRAHSDGNANNSTGNFRITQMARL